MCIGKRFEAIGFVALMTVLGAVVGDEGSESVVARRSRLTIAGGVRQDNWSEGRFECRWTKSQESTENSKPARLKIEACGTRRYNRVARRPSSFSASRGQPDG
jgi:hypothetical protein